MYRHILMPTDGSDCSQEAIAHGLVLASSLGASVSFLYVLDATSLALATEGLHYTDYAGMLLEDLRKYGNSVLACCQAQAEAAGVAADERRLEVAHPVEAILEAAKACDLVVMGSHGRRGLGRLLLGSVTEGVMRRSDKPVLVVRCAGRASEQGASQAESAQLEPSARQ